jgi:hypothetical protein
MTNSSNGPIALTLLDPTSGIKETSTARHIIAESALRILNDIDFPPFSSLISGFSEQN